MNPLVIVIPVLILAIFAVMAVMAANNRTVDILQKELELSREECLRLRVRREELYEENVRLKFESERSG